MTADLPTSVVDLDAFARALAGDGRFLDAASDTEVTVAAAAGVADRLVVRHGTPRCDERPGRRVVAAPAELRAVQRRATVSEPVGVLVHVAPPARPRGAGLDPYRPPFMAVLRTLTTSVRLRFDGLYLAVADASALPRAARFGVELAAALQELPGFGVGELYLSCHGAGADVDGEVTAARREVLLHSAALGAVAPLVRIDPGPAAFPQCHVVPQRVVGVAPGVVRIDAAGDDLVSVGLEGTGQVTSRRCGAGHTSRAVTTSDGARTLGRLSLPDDIAAGDRVVLPVVGRTGLVVPSRYRLLGTTATGTRELLAGLGITASRPHRIAG